VTRVFFWPADSGGCAWYRCHMPAGALAELGHETHASTMMPDEWADADVIVGQRVSNPGPSMRWQQLAKLGHSKLVYEVDDDLFSTDQTSADVHGFFTRPDIRDNIRANMAVADLVTVSTEALAEVMRAYNPNVAVIPNSVPAWVLNVPTVPYMGPVTIGWAGGPTHELDWAEALSEVTRFIGRDHRVELHMMGYCPPELWRRLPMRQRRFTPWIQSVPDLYLAIDFHAGLAPLRATVFNRSKSPIKALELAALGIPCVASDVGPYSGFVRHGETGFLVKRPHEWAQHLRVLTDDVDLRTAMGRAARALAAEHTIERQAHLWEEALTG
jgi:glycosyltransferase involved in cell wall biosynthesis